MVEKAAGCNCAALCRLFNELCDSEIPYKKLEQSRFEELFLTDAQNVTKATVCAYEDEKLAGFASGCVKEGKDIGYITFVATAPEYRRRGIGKSLLTALEEELKKLRDITKFQIIFFNPVNLEWIIEGTPGHDHPNLPGVDVSSKAYIFFKNMNYYDSVFQNSFYLPLDKFSMPPKMTARISALATNGLEICYAKKDEHTGFEELLDNLGNELWKTEITAAIESQKPVLIAANGNRAVGFTGPLAVQTSGRGYFSGIGVHSDFRGCGLGKCLFYALCGELKKLGAEYMTLFTGETNPARKMYTAAGFKIVKTWSDMEKTIKEQI